jgi:O-antigen/teichoic acid export membrane protein
MGLDSNQYGFYVFLWSISSALFFTDMGMGIAAQKKTGEFESHQDIDLLNKQINTIFVTYLIILCLFFLINYFIITPGLSTFLVIDTSNHSIQFYQNLFWIFSNLIAFNFTISFFREILIGLRKTYIIEFINALFSLSYLGIVMSFYFLDLDLSFIVHAVPLNQTVSLIIFVFLATRSVKGLKINPFLFSKKTLKEILSFSLHAYTQAVITIIQKNVNHIILGGILGTVYVGFYQIATKMQEIMKMLNDFYQSNIMPTTTYYVTNNKLKELKAFIINSNKFVFFIGALSLFPFFMMVEPLLWIWLKVNNPEIIFVARLLVIEMFFRNVFSSVNTRYLLMSGKEKTCTKYAVIEFSLNIVLSFLALKFFDMAMMAVARIFITFSINLFGIMRTTGHQLSLTLSDYYEKCCKRTVYISLIPLAYLSFFCYQINLAEWSTLKFIIVSLSYGAIFLLLATYFILDNDEKTIVIKRFPKLKILFPKLKVRD